MSTAVIYARFSSSKQREASIDDQVRVCREWCEARNYEVVAVYADYAISGRTDERPQFQAMVAAAPESDIVLVYMMDRFSRDAYDAPLYKKKLRDKGVRVVSAMENIPEGAEAILIEKLYEGLAAVESAHIAERTKRGMHGNALKYMHNGVRVFGYDFAPDGRYAINQEQAAIVREIYARHNAGESSTAIARDLAARGVTTTTGHKTNYTFVHNLLHNEKYRGVYMFGDIRADGEMPRIIDDDVYYLAQGIKPKRDRTKETWHDYPLAGRALCAECGHNLRGVSAHGRSSVYRYYNCAHKCVRAIRADELEDGIVDAIRDLLNDPAIAREIAQEVGQAVKGKDTKAERNAAAKRLRDAQKAQENLSKALRDGCPYEAVRKDLSLAQSQEKQAAIDLAKADAMVDFDVDDFADFLRFGATLDDAALLDCFVHQAFVSDTEIIAVLNYDRKGEPARINLERVRTNSFWLPSQTALQTSVAIVGGALIVRYKRAA